MGINIEYYFSDYVNYLSRFLQGRFIEQGKSLPFYKQQLTMVSIPVEEVFAQLRTLSGWQVYHVREHELLAASDDAVLSIVLEPRKDATTSCQIELWAMSVPIGEQTFSEISSLISAQGEAPRTINIRWYYFTEKELSSRMIKEEVDETILPSAYPWLPEQVDRFVQRYIRAKESILILYGPPGAGKTRLIRHLLASLSAQLGRNSEILYATDTKVMQSDAFFIKFMTDNADAMVIEDADHLLEPRSDGNTNLHRFLSCSDGLFQAHGRKMIFSTNLPSRLNIDEALLRPGRCFACIESRKLTKDESSKLLEDMFEHDVASTGTSKLLRSQEFPDKASLAEIYSIAHRVRMAAEASLDNEGQVNIQKQASSALPPVMETF